LFLPLAVKYHLLNTPRTPLSLWVQERLSSNFEGSLDRTADLVANLPGLSTWVPSEPAMNVFEVLSLGAAISKVDEEGFQQLFKNISKSILLKGRPNFEDTAELYSAALLSSWTSSVQQIKTAKGKKTPDFEAKIGEISIECEVTNSEQKQNYSELRSKSAELTKRIQAVVIAPWVRVRFMDIANEDDFLALTNAAASLAPGDNRESANRWYIHAFDSSIQPHIEKGTPSWWPKQYAHPVSLSASFELSIGSGNHRVDTLPTVEAFWCLSNRSYVNSLSKKQHAEQASGDKPFLILCDVTNLPGALGWHQDNLPQMLSSWSKKISAILLFRRTIREMESLEFEYQLYLNTSAIFNLPPELCVETKGEMTIPFDRFD
jgi:hypothetical protein